jgi:hypothetical protein
MKIKQITARRWHGLTMTVDLECEHCGQVEENRYVYGDRHLYDEILPEMECLKCRKSQAPQHKETPMF